jgi:hypothetical protein
VTASSVLTRQEASWRAIRIAANDSDRPSAHYNGHGVASCVAETLMEGHYPANATPGESREGTFYQQGRRVLVSWTLLTSHL